MKCVVVFLGQKMTLRFQGTSRSSLDPQMLETTETMMINVRHLQRLIAFLKWVEWNESMQLTSCS